MSHMEMWRRKRHVQRPWGRGGPGVCGSQRSGGTWWWLMRQGLAAVVASPAFLPREVGPR